MPRGVMTQTQADARRNIWPWYYTTQPGGLWLKWTFGHLHPRELMRCANFNGLTVLHGVKLHALAFETPAAGPGAFPRWDAENRWTTTFAQARKAYPKGLHGDAPPWAPKEEKPKRMMGRPLGSRTGE